MFKNYLMPLGKEGYPEIKKNYYVENTSGHRIYIQCRLVFTKGLANDFTNLNTKTGIGNRNQMNLK